MFEKKSLIFGKKSSILKKIDLWKKIDFQKFSFVLIKFSIFNQNFGHIYFFIFSQNLQFCPTKKICAVFHQN